MAHRLVPLLLLAAALAGCAADAPSPSVRAARSATAADADLANAFGGRPDRSMSGSAPATLVAQSIDVYQVSVPLGAVSRSQEFWKRVDEQSVDIATYDLLLKNGVRVGVAPGAEWDYFRGILDQHPALTTRRTVTGPNASGTAELSMKKNVDAQNLFYLTDENALVGERYERCENLINVSFQAAPRKPGQARVTLCPVVRATRRHYQVTVRNEEKEIVFTRPEKLYKLNLTADVPVDGFLVVAPSSEAKRAMSFGNAFLVEDGPAEQLEHVLLIVPRVMVGEFTGSDDLGTTVAPAHAPTR